MTSKLSSHTVSEALEEGKSVDRSTRVAELEKQLAKVRKDIAEQERLAKRWKLVQTACNKLKREMGKTLTKEEYQAIDGIYIFLHSGCVDFVRQVPSATDKGENKSLNKDLGTVEALKELEDLTG